MPSAFIRAEHSYPALPLARQLEHHRFVLPNPLVLGKKLASFLRPQQIGTDLSHDGLNPAHVPLSLANSQTLGSFSTPRMR